MLITYQHSVHFSLFQSTSSFRFGSVNFSHFGQFWSNSVYFNSIRSIWPTLVCSVPILVHSVYFGQFDHVRSILSNSVYLVYIGPIQPIRSIQSTPIYSVQFDLYGPLRSIRSCLIHSVHFILFGPFQITSIQVGVPTKEWQNTSLG